MEEPHLHPSAQYQADGIQTIADTHAIGGTAIVGEFLLEESGLRTGQKTAGLNHTHGRLDEAAGIG